MKRYWANYGDRIHGDDPHRASKTLCGLHAADLMDIGATRNDITCKRCVKRIKANPLFQQAAAWPKGKGYTDES